MKLATKILVGLFGVGVSFAILVCAISLLRVSSFEDPMLWDGDSNEV